jgi:hypothetical protein
MLGCPISRNYDGLGYDIPTNLLAIEDWVRKEIH